jgi:hypothetical protein
MPEWWPTAIAQGRGRENAGNSSGRMLAAVARAVGATKTLRAFPSNFNSTVYIHAFFRTCVFAIINQEVEQEIRHVDVVFHYIFMYLPTFKLMM